jgi:hypothetical protein
MRWLVGGATSPDTVVNGARLFRDEDVAPTNKKSNQGCRFWLTLQNISVCYAPSCEALHLPLFANLAQQP